MGPSTSPTRPREDNSRLLTAGAPELVSPSYVAVATNLEQARAAWVNPDKAFIILAGQYEVPDHLRNSISDFMDLQKGLGKKICSASNANSEKLPELAAQLRAAEFSGNISAFEAAVRPGISVFHQLLNVPDVVFSLLQNWSRNTRPHLDLGITPEQTRAATAAITFRGPTTILWDPVDMLSPFTRARVTLRDGAVPYSAPLGCWVILKWNGPHETPNPAINGAESMRVSGTLGY